MEKEPDFNEKMKRMKENLEIIGQKAKAGAVKAAENVRTGAEAAKKYVEEQAPKKGALLKDKLAQGVNKIKQNESAVRLSKTVQKNIEVLGQKAKEGALKAKEGTQAAKTFIQEQGLKTSAEVKEKIKQGREKLSQAMDKTEQKENPVVLNQPMPQNAEELNPEIKKDDEHKKVAKRSVQKVKSKPQKAKIPVTAIAALVAGSAITGGVVVNLADGPDTHCAYFSLQQEYYLIQACSQSCAYGVSIETCAERIREWECKERYDYSEASNRASTCPINNGNHYGY